MGQDKRHGLKVIDNLQLLQIQFFCESLDGKLPVNVGEFDFVAKDGTCNCHSNSDGLRTTLKFQKVRQGRFEIWKFGCRKFNNRSRISPVGQSGKPNVGGTNVNYNRR